MISIIIIKIIIIADNSDRRTQFTIGKRGAKPESNGKCFNKNKKTELSRR